MSNRVAVDGRLGSIGRPPALAQRAYTAAVRSAPDLHVDELAELCRRFGVRRLEVFGSAASQAFDPQRSDFDFIVDFGDRTSGLFDDYFALKGALEVLYGRPVDLVMAGAIRNPHFLRAVNATRHLLYAAEDAQAA